MSLELLRVGGHLVEEGVNVALPDLEVDQVVEADPAMSVRLLERYGTVLEELQSVGRLMPRNSAASWVVSRRRSSPASCW